MHMDKKEAAVWVEEHMRMWLENFAPAPQRVVSTSTFFCACHPGPWPPARAPGGGGGLGRHGVAVGGGVVVDAL